MIKSSYTKTFSRLELKVIVLSVLVATSVHAKESKGIYFGLGIAQSKVNLSEDDDILKYKKNNWKALIGMRLNSNWSIEGQYTNLAADTFAYVDDSGHKIHYCHLNLH
jgi:hypothetical protein